jgi:catechol 2,3-dioxygenase-like lactoylglutathione lyase family enzyme
MKANRILETVIYAQDLEAAEEFYARVSGLEVYSRENGRHVFFCCGSGMFLVFNPDRTETEQPFWHGCRGRGHVAWAVEESELDSWRHWLQKQGVPIESDFTWPLGGRSLYFRDPAGNSLELATSKVWANAAPSYL